MPREENWKADELARMANKITQWDEEDIVNQVELIAQADQIPTLNPIQMKRSIGGK